jgi:MerR family copper efflux transcriptional regulator
MPTLMTIGELSRRTGVPIRALRDYTDWGLIYAVERTPGNYRQYDTEALWCVNMIRGLRGLGLTLAEIRELSSLYSKRTDQPIGPQLANFLHKARTRVDARMAELEQTRRRIDDFEAEHRDELSGRGPDIWVDDPRGNNRDNALDSHPGVRP